MRTISASELARKADAVLGRVVGEGATITIERDRRAIARLVPAEDRQTASEALSGLYGILDAGSAADWAAGGRHGADDAEQDPGS